MTPLKERLASLETKVEILLELLSEIREDLKETPTREELDSIENRLNNIEEYVKKFIWKVAMATGALSTITTIIAVLLSRLLMK